MYYRERAAHMYRPSLFNIAMGLAEVPYITVDCAVLTCILC